MSLYEILNERGCMNLLKELYDVQFILKTAHTLKLSEVALKLPKKLNLHKSLAFLSQAELVDVEKLEHDTIISMTNKGKAFFSQFDALKKVLENEITKVEGPRIEYGLTDLEKRILILCYKIQSEIGTLVPLRMLTQEVYPHKDPSNRIGAISRYVSKLQELQLMEKVKTEQKSFAKVTETGERVINQQFVESVL